jgi:hypothetical protein
MSYEKEHREIACPNWFKDEKSWLTPSSDLEE